MSLSSMTYYNCLISWQETFTHTYEQSDLHGQLYVSSISPYYDEALCKSYFIVLECISLYAFVTSAQRILTSSTLLRRHFYASRKMAKPKAKKGLQKAKKIKRFVAVPKKRKNNVNQPKLIELP